MSRVNVRVLASIYSACVTTIRSSGTVVTVMEEVVNSSGQTWYAVKLANGMMGYIRGDLLRVEVEPVNAAPEVVYLTLEPSPVPAVTPEVIYVLADPDPTPTPVIIYVQREQLAEVTPEVVYATPAPDTTPIPTDVYHQR